MKTLIAIIAVVAASASIIPGTPMREIEDRAAAGNPAAITALRDSASAGNSRAMNFLGFLYWQGMGTRLDRDSSLFFLRKAVDAGDIKATANLGHLLLTGAPELKADTTEALRLLDLAAGRHSSAAIRELADFFEKNSGDSTSAGAIKKVADAYSHGDILRYNYKKSIIYYDRAAQLGDTAAKRIVSELLEIFPDALPHK